MSGAVAVGQRCLESFQGAGGERVVDPSAATSTLDQPGFAQNLQVVAEQVSGDRRFGLEVADATRAPHQKMEQLKSDRISNSREERGGGLPLFSRS